MTTYFDILHSHYIKVVSLSLPVVLYDISIPLTGYNWKDMFGYLIDGYRYLGDHIDLTDEGAFHLT